MLKRTISAVIAIGILVLVLISRSQLVFNIALVIISNLSLWEFFNAMKRKNFKPFSILGYISTLYILCIGFVEQDYLIMIISLMFPLLLLVAFGKSILTNNKFNISDIAVTMVGILYTTYLYSFLSYTYAMPNGKYYVWFIFGGAWITDTFAYIIGKLIGKHKFSEISPKKSIEGCIGGIVGATVFYLAYTFFLNNNVEGIELDYIFAGILGAVVSVIAQIGDFSASSIKRYCEIKDFSEIMPGHGGALDRFDSILLISPIIYICLTLCNMGII